METESSLVTIVSCDVIRHSSADERDQLARVTAINDMVAEAVAGSAEGDVVWASGGDGGHVLFRQEAWEQAALDLAFRWKGWSLRERVPLRIVCHRGPVAHITGADGRSQPVGHGINDAGNLLAHVDVGIVASDAFRKAMAHVPEVDFHDPRRLLANDGRLHWIHLLSCGHDRSSWGTSFQNDHAALESAVTQGRSWDILYHAKRIWQSSSEDRAVARGIEAIEQSKLKFTDRRTGKDELNPFLGQSHLDELAAMLRLGKLVERRRGEFICHYGDSGDSLFVILRGEVGVFNSEGEDRPGVLHTLRQGEIVGELAYALARDRTADLVALTDVALLSFKYEDVHLLSTASIGSAAARNVALFINYRALQHVSDNAPYLLGPDRDGPLNAGERGWDETLAAVRRHAELITLRKLPFELTVDLVSAEAPKRKGIYVLAGGTLEAEGELLEGRDFPVLWVDLPRFLSTRPRTYGVRSQVVKILWIGAGGIAELDPGQRAALHRELGAVTAEPAPGGTINQVGTNSGIVIQAGQVENLHVHRGPEPPG
ncbi:cyclic nucleotide-binding domain-containing protein [Lentzea cavernae]|uniref:Cyclic nucleotide-binding domain-containing protein n=1 Tax=Lentzea cavernae TaxID=2020703 RepID=A0ABQ3MKU3_9PSEU|nr:cyclic nucleotide-binding domain-containing protein [Lentzea cavernae]GHH48705.1 hypothetical protein GCM10017774_54940 [Lentzea cavernae]